MAANKIWQKLDEVKDDSNISARRWVWELIQNAKDVPNVFGRVSIEIELVSENELQFKHNGNPFEEEDVAALILPTSSKSATNKDENITGMFGTGFICTHLLSDVIKIKGVLKSGGYRQFELVLDRSGKSSDDLKPRIRALEELFREPDKHFKENIGYEEKREETDYDTIFVYNLKTSDNYKDAVAGLDDLVNTLPITLVTQAKKIKQVRVIDQVRGKDVTYECKTQPLGGNVIFSVIRINDTTKQYLSYITDQVALTTEVVRNENGYTLVKRDNKQPILYRDFPLIGSEKFFFPYTLNGFHLHPTEKRNSIFLNRNTNKAKENREVIDHAVEASLKFNKWLIAHGATNRYLMAYSQKPEVDYDKDVALPWINQLQANWRAKLLEQQLVESEDGIHFVKEISVPSFSGGTSASAEFFDLLDGFYIGRGYLPKKQYQEGWLKVLNADYKAWNAKLKYEKENFLEDLSDLGSVEVLCQRLNMDEHTVLAWLNKVYAFLIKHKCQDDLKEYAIVPNEKGVFMRIDRLRSDQTDPIPSELKSIYNEVSDTAIEDELVHAGVDASAFDSNIDKFDLKDVIDWFNNGIESREWSSEKKNTVVYALISLMPQVADATYTKRRKSMYRFSSAYREMDELQTVAVEDLHLWEKADEYWFSNSYAGIEESNTVSTMSEEFFLSEKTEEETLNWLNEYIAFYQENSHGDLIKERCVFPDQFKLELKPLKKLRYDAGIPEAFKDLADYAEDTSFETDKYRSVLLNRAIKGYEQHKPLKLSEVYDFVKQSFDDSRDDDREIIAKQSIAIVLNSDDESSKQNRIYGFVKTVLTNDMPDKSLVDSAEGFNWDFANKYCLRMVCEKISESENLSGLCELSDELSDKSDQELIEWVDELIEFLHSNKTFWSIVSDEDDGIGIWLNQHNDFCRLQDLRIDGGIPDELKDLCEDNKHIDWNLRAEMYSLDAQCEKYVMGEISLKEVGEHIDDIVKDYVVNNNNKQEKDFVSLVFELNKLIKSNSELEKIMKYFVNKKHSLIVWTLGEGETMDLVGEIIQAGDDKLRLVKQILDGRSVEDLAKACDILDSAKEDGAIVTPEQRPELTAMVPDFENNGVLTERRFTVSEVQYSGLSSEEIKGYVSDAKRQVVEYFKRLNEEKHHGLRFDETRIAMDSYSQLYGIYDKNGNELPIVAHSYRGPQFRYFDLNPYDWYVLSKPGSMLWVVTGEGLKCIPMYALPIRRIQISLPDGMPKRERAAMLTLMHAMKQYSPENVRFDFGNCMPYQGFDDTVAFDYIPNELKKCTEGITMLCDEKLPALEDVYNNGKNIPLLTLDEGTSYAEAIAETSKESMREMFAATEAKPETPIVGAGLESIL